MPTLAQQALMQRLNLAPPAVAIPVTRPGQDPVETTGIWHVPLAEAPPFGTDFTRREPRRVLEVPRDDTLDDVPRGSVIVAADRDGAAATTWRADGLDRTDDPLRTYVIVVPA